MAKIQKIALLAAVLGSLWAAVSCSPETRFLDRDAVLRFSQDTVFLDTVFAQVGSSTRSVRIINPTNDPLLIRRIELAGGTASPFRINVNGQTGPLVENVALDAGDSLWVFVDVTAPPQGLQFLYTDSIVVQTGNLRQDIDLVTLALDAHFHYPTSELVIPQQDPNRPLRIPYKVLPPNTVWTADKPHVVYGYVVVDSAQSFRIEPGTQVHFHANSGIWVYRGGSLEVDPLSTGSMQNPVVFQGDRLEPFYRDIPGQWGGVLGGIFVQSGATATFKNAVVKNGTIGIRVDSTASLTPNLTLHNTVVEHHSRAGVYSGFGYIRATNTVIADAGLYGLYSLGGRVSMDHCTLANYFGSGRSTPTLGLFNYYEDANQVKRTRPLLQADFANCIVTGNNVQEVGIGKIDGAAFEYRFDKCLLTIRTQPDPPVYSLSDVTRFDGCLINQSARLKSPLQSNYLPDSLSPALNVGRLPAAQRVPISQNGISRLPYPDLGALERPE
jgi:hypothetical protein